MQVGRGHEGGSVTGAPPAAAHGRAPLRDPAEWIAEGAPPAHTEQGGPPWSVNWTAAGQLIARARTLTRPPGPLRPPPVRIRLPGAPVRRRRREARPVSAATTRSRTPDRLCAEAVDLARDGGRGSRRARCGRRACGPGLGGRPGRHALLRVQGARLPGLALGGDRRRGPPAPSSSPSTRRSCCPARTRSGPPSGCRGASGCGPATWAPATCCPPRPTTCAWSPATPARTRRRRTRGGLRGAGRAGRGGGRRAGRPRDARGRRRPARGSIAAVAEELGMRRARVLSRYGLHAAADRWEESFGGKTPMAQAAPASCVSCGFLVPIAGSLRRPSASAPTSSVRRTATSWRWTTAAAGTPRRRSCRSRRGRPRRCSTRWRRTCCSRGRRAGRGPCRTRRTRSDDLGHS